MSQNGNGVNCATEPSGNVAQTEVLPPATVYPLHHRAGPINGIVLSRGMVCGGVGVCIGIALGIWLSNLIRDGRSK
jgi:hypothetical protein